MVSTYASKIKTEVNSAYKIGAVGSLKTAQLGDWWTAMAGTGYDFAVIHGNYSVAPNMNPLITTSECPTKLSEPIGPLNPLNVAGKWAMQGDTMVCRKTQWPLFDTATDITTFSNLIGKPVAITEWGTANVGDNFWSNGNGLTAPISAHNAMLNTIMHTGELLSLSVDPSKLQSALIWPSMISRTDTPSPTADNDYRSILKKSDASVTPTQQGFYYIRDALKGKYIQKVQPSEGSTEYGLVEWQTQWLLNRYSVFVNARNNPNNITIPITTTGSSTYTVTGKSLAAGDADITCTITDLPPDGFKITIHPYSFAVLKAEQ